MNRRSTRSIFGVLLGLFLALGMSLSAVQAGDMAVKMAAASDMGNGGSHDCGGCGGGDDGATKAGPCLPGCTAQMLAVVPPTSELTMAPVPYLSQPKAAPSLGRPSSPDPYPPRSSDFA